jgi:hypothetical protein
MPNMNETSGTDAKDWTIAYLACPQDAANGFAGAVLLTDARARPIHFAYVTPIRPTRMQRLLYGSTLDEHVKVDVIASKLFQGAPHQPHVIFVETPDLLATRRITRLPTAFLSKAATTTQDAGNLSALRYDTGSNAEDQEQVGRIIAELESAFDLLEPFTRMRDALKEALKAPQG